MNQIEQRRLIQEDLYNELRYLLIAATTWQVCRDHEISDDTPWFENQPHHLQVIAMDSACLHARALHEFFYSSHDIETASASRDFGVTLNETALYLRYKDTLNKRLFHVDLRRPNPLERKGTTPIPRDLNRQPVEFGKDILKLWGLLAQKAQPASTVLLEARRDAVTEATHAASSLSAPPIF